MVCMRVGRDLEWHSREINVGAGAPRYLGVAGYPFLYFLTEPGQPIRGRSMAELTHGLLHGLFKGESVAGVDEREKE